MLLSILSYGLYFFSSKTFGISRSDRVRKQENKIRKLYMEQREKLAEVSVPGIPDLVSASDLLRIEPASSSKRRFDDLCPNVH